LTNASGDAFGAHEAEAERSDRHAAAQANWTNISSGRTIGLQ
jgi:hypothetical protein